MVELHSSFRTIAVSSIISLLVSFNSYAATLDGVEIDIKRTVGTLEERNKSINDADDRHFELINGNWYVVDSYENRIGGWSYDEHGNLYKANADGAIYINGVFEGERFNPDGVYMPKGIWDRQEYMEKCSLLESGEALKFNSASELGEFFEYYLKQYRFWDNKFNTGIDYVDNELSIRLPENLLYDKSYIERAVIEKFGTPVGDNVKELVLDACCRVANIIEYDETYTETNAEQCLRDNKGVCWFYSKCVKTLLESVGLQVEDMVGFYLGQEHMWIRVRDGENWIYADPSGVDTSGIYYSNIGYREFISMYVPNNNVAVNETY